MRQTLAVGTRELRSYLYSPAGYIIITLFLVFVGLLFAYGVMVQGQPATLRLVFEWITLALFVLCPAIAMRTISEELRTGTFEALMTAPVSETTVILGKFFGSSLFLLLMLAPTTLYIVALEMYGRPDYGEILCGYLGVVLAGAVYLAGGILASTLSSSQVLALLLSWFVWLGVILGTWLLPSRLDDRWADIVIALNPALRLNDFAIGLVDTSNVIYFLSLTVLFLIAAVKSLQMRRLR